MELKEVVVVEAVRTPTGRSGWAGAAKGGVFSGVSAQHLLVTALRGLVDKVKEKAPAFDEVAIEDVAVGCLSQIGEQGLNVGRVGVLAADLPEEVAGWTVNRYCNAGLQAINSQAHALMCGAGDIAIAAGVENMSHYGMGSDLQAAIQAGMPVTLHPRAIERAALAPMGVSAQMLADRYSLDRGDMDRFALWSHQKAVLAMRDEEDYRKRVVPVEVDGEGGEKTLVEFDEPPRAQAVDDADAALAKIASLPPRFRDDGTVTAATSSAIVDGAAAVMLMTAEKAEELGLEPMARIVSTAVAGSEPLIMLLGPVPAMHKALDRAHLTMDDVDVFEPNEAFVSPVLAFCIEFGLEFDDPRINPTGGACAIGHPIGCTGVLYFAEMVHHMTRNGLQYGLQTLCGGGGVGIATVVERA
ncbi:MAG: thiolase family protein [Actinobacteria bacterium]|jgi:acetyl-CoA acyltransferase|nr:MAG: thiolase family protein [Actinomycetota bacterium]